MRKIIDIIKLIRVKHWVKNYIIFLPIVLTGNLTRYEKLRESVIAFVIFSFIASIVYIINDIHDLKADQLHPTKQNRPLASGRISLSEAKIILVTLIVACLVIWSEESWNANYILIPIFYLLINLGYSLGLKNVPLLDIFILMLGYVLRLELGGCGQFYRNIKLDVFDDGVGSFLFGNWKKKK